MATHLKIDFVSDVACPWCAVGLGALELALEELHNEVTRLERILERHHEEQERLP